VGNPVTWTYQVTNTGNTILSGVRITDSRLPASAIRCPATPANLLASATMVCSAIGTAKLCGYTNQGCASANGVTSVCAGSAYNGVKPSISITKYTNFFTNAALKNVTSPVCIRRCEGITWAYVVSNTGDELLTNVRIVDNRLSAAAQPKCPITNLAPWWSITCVAYGQAQPGPYTNVATAYGTPNVGGPEAFDVDHNTFLGTDPRIQLTVKVNGVVAKGVATAVSNPVVSECAPPVYGSDSGEGEGESGGKGKSVHGSKSVHGKSVHVNTKAAEELPTDVAHHDTLAVDGADLVADAHADVLSSKSGNGEGKNKKGNSGQKDGKGSTSTPPPPTYPDGAYIDANAPINIVIIIQNVGDEAIQNVLIRLPDSDVNTGAVPFVNFKTADITCTSSNLPVGGQIVCTAPATPNVNSGAQYINVMAEGFGACTGHYEPVSAQGKWFTPVPVIPTPKPPTTGGSSSSSGEGKSNKKNGCDSTYWAMAPATAYPSYWTPSTPFYIAAGLSKDPLSGQTFADVFMATGDGLNAFYRAAAAALLNAATVSGFGLSKWEVQSRIESALSRYFRSGMSDTTSIDLWRKQFNGWARPC